MYVYIIQSLEFPNQIYSGKTRSVKKRLEAHNSGLNPSTKRYRLWKLIWFGWFETDELASKFELYLKNGSGIAFRKKRLVH